MISKLVTYATIVFGGTISGALVGSLAGPVRILMSTEEIGTLGACIGACLAIIGCKFAMEHHEAREQNRELFRALEARLARVVRAPSLNRSTIDGKAGSPRAEPPDQPDDRRPGLPTEPRAGTEGALGSDRVSS